MKKRLSDNPWFVRIMLLLFYFPFGLIFLACSRTMKRKVTAGIFYFYFYMIFLFVESAFTEMLAFIYRGHNIQAILSYMVSYFHENNVGLLLAFYLPFWIISVLISYFISKKIEKNKIEKMECEKITCNFNNPYSFVNSLDASCYPMTSSVPTTPPRVPPMPSVRPTTPPRVPPMPSVGSMTSPINKGFNERETGYEKRSLLTDNELHFYQTLRGIADKYNLNVLSKLRLADIVGVDSSLDNTEWWSNFGKIKSKHVDFALAKKDNLEIVLVIELDDYSHKRVDRIERDKFVDSIFNNVGIPILHVYSTTDLENKIVSKIINYIN